MKREDTSYFLQILSTLIAVGLPLMQFTFFWLPPNIKQLYLSKDLFIFSSIITALVSYMLILVVVREPYGTFTVPFLKKYSKFYGEKKRSWNPIQFQYRQLSRIFIPTVFFLGLIFVSIGVSQQQGDAPTLLSVIQSGVYSLIIILSVFVSAEYFSERKFAHDSDQSRATRGLSAINLAKETNSFPEMPNIHLVGVVELTSTYSGFGNDVVTYVEIGKKYYAINTDSRVDAINAVVEVDKKAIKKLAEIEESKLNPPDNQVSVQGNKG